MMCEFLHESQREPCTGLSFRTLMLGTALLLSKPVSLRRVFTNGETEREAPECWRPYPFELRDRLAAAGEPAANGSSPSPSAQARICRRSNNVAIKILRSSLPHSAANSLARSCSGDGSRVASANSIASLDFAGNHSTGTFRRYPRRPTVSINCGLAANHSAHD